MTEEFKIKSWCRIKSGIVSLNGKMLFPDDSENFSDFSKAVYKYFETSYPKFFKMDNLSKLTFLAADLLLKNEKLEANKENSIAIVFSNKASSLDTDRKHQNSIENDDAYFPSPAVFVYTLPNICIGEISIKYSLYSENSFFIFDHFNAELLEMYANNLMRTEKAEKVLCGWVDFDEGNYDAFLYLVEKEGEIGHNNEEINRLYDTL